MKVLPAVPANIEDQLSWWQKDLRQVSRVVPYPSLRGDYTADVVIIGGGFTGLWTAAVLKERRPELRVAVVETYWCGAGASSRNGGNVHGYWSALPTLVPLFGVDESIRIAQLGSVAQERVRRLAQSPGLDVWWEEQGYLRAATSTFQATKLIEFLQFAKKLGVEDTVRKLEPREFSSYCASPRFQQILLFSEGATVNPARLCFKLRKLVKEAGVEIFENTPVVRIEDGSPNVVVCDQGTIKAAHVVVATYTGTMSIPAVARGTSLFSSFPVMSEPNPEALQSMGYTVARGIADLRMFTHYFRRTPDGRILMGTGSGPLEFGGRHGSEKLRSDPDSFERAEIGLERFFPGVPGIAAKWGFPIEVTADRIPCFGTISGTRVHYGSGYSGHGVNATAIAGECLASLVLGVSDRWTNSAFCRKKRTSFPPEPLRYWGGRAVRDAIVRCEDAEDARLRPSKLDRMLASAPKYLGLKIGTR